jgi:hypothetical protein
MSFLLLRSSQDEADLRKILNADRSDFDSVPYGMCHLRL